MVLNFGDMFYSDYFRSNCVVVRFVSEREWYFMVEKGCYAGVIQRAQVWPSEVKIIRGGDLLCQEA